MLCGVSPLDFTFVSTLKVPIVKKRTYRLTILSVVYLQHEEAIRYLALSLHYPMPSVRVQAPYCGHHPSFVPLRSSTRPLVLDIAAVFAPDPFPARCRVTAGDGILAGFILRSWLFLGPGLIGWGSWGEEHVLVLVWLLWLVAVGGGGVGWLNSFVWLIGLLFGDDDLEALWQ